MDTLDKVNKMSKSDFISIFGNVFEKTTWIAEKVYNLRPFKNYNELSKKFLNIFENEKKENLLKILSYHPDLAVGKITTIDSINEQSGAKLNQCTKQEFEEFSILNAKYKEKFNFPFIIAVAGKNKNEILKIFRQRIKNEIDKEFSEAVFQVKKIAIFRIEQIKQKGI